MSNGAGQFLQYHIFTEAAFTTIFGTTVGGEVPAGRRIDDADALRAGSGEPGAGFRQLH